MTDVSLVLLELASVGNESNLEFECTRVSVIAHSKRQECAQWNMMSRRTFGRGNSNLTMFERDCLRLCQWNLTGLDR